MFRRRMVMRRGAPLLRGALVGGAAYMMGRGAAQRAQHETDQDEAIAAAQQQQIYVPAPPPQQYVPSDAGAPPRDMSTQLGQLAQLRQQGLLTDAEFETAKARLLAS